MPLLVVRQGFHAQRYESSERFKNLCAFFAEPEAALTIYFISIK